MGNVYSLVPVKNTRCVAYLWDGARPKWPSSEDYFMPQSFGNYLCSRWLQLLCTRCCPLNRQGPQINGKLARRKKGTTQTTSKTITHKKQNAALQPIYWRHEDMEKTSARESSLGIFQLPVGNILIWNLIPSRLQLGHENVGVGISAGIRRPAAPNRTVV